MSLKLSMLGLFFTCLAIGQLSASRTLKAPRLGFQERFDAAINSGSNDPLFIEMPLDHFNASNKETFPNRYWVNSTYYEAGGPVFLFDSGEQNAEPLLPYYLQEYHGLSAVMQLAKRYRGIAFLWEHRFYGDSLPFPVNENTTADQWQYLNTEQALEDVVFFADSFPTTAINSSSIDPTLLAIHPSSVPWVFLGGSYPGVRGALLRQRNPSTIFASWASSAPVQAQVDMASYYKAAERSLTRNCSADWVAVTKFVDDTLNDSNETLIIDVKFDLLKARLSGPGGNTSAADGLTRQRANATSNVDAASILMDPLDFYQYYGFQDSLLPFCNLLETQNSTAEPLEGGIAAALGIDSAFNAFLVAIGELDYDSIPGNPDDPVQDRSWMRQYCSEYGFYQRGDPENPLSIETSFLSLELFQQQCNETFPDLPPSPQVQLVNKYGGWNMTPSNILFTNGEFDPWRTMGLASIESNSPQRKPTASVPPCNSPAPGDLFFGMTYDRMVHVTDMRVLLIPDSNHSDFKTVGFYSPVSQEPFYTGLGLFQLALDEWLPCFQSSSSTDMLF
ncbi:serine carboxypeptidase S28-domain-containing protein [Mycena rosella]|uniref:Serine carboxypeptidase S28-domain-containing protein n=1 Tax=Mycena rosella TaxID=1033263 RepID=A0AAD7DMQ0_MYCRO|nr:serine carboxypeptidase S28-domain-containing protein [Mycena rosella]